MEEQLLLLISRQLEEIHVMLTRQQEEGKIPKRLGRPTKEHIVFRYREKYPNGKKMECVKATGISIKTVSKYWDSYNTP